MSQVIIKHSTENLKNMKFTAMGRKEAATTLNMDATGEMFRSLWVKYEVNTFTGTL